MINFGRGQHEDHFCEIILKLNQWFRGEMSLKHFLSRALAALCLMEQNHLCNFGRRHHQEQICEIILNLDL